LFKAKEGENFNHPREIGFAFHGAGAGIGQKGAFCKGLAQVSVGWREIHAVVERSP